ncbi:chromatin associated protein KTI12 [Sistotremastrum niveocremeum HHB9708]|uniref:Chromatin associated protein KTI12 n=1 Tax=Sistotremastrum niveocremeum HHB9708 TaxID=1314777 RepID=A0A164P1M3_9AGAM|nr:chromatin associated protein KTI12 [Sistotremastrum niveocremeum HHB9708]
MALITVTGYPCSGKSKRVNDELVPSLQRRIDDPSYTGPIKRIVVLSDDSLNIPRSVYSDTKAEKIARGTLFTNIQREMNRETIVIADGLNYIKGFRYQMYCAARELSIRVATIFVAATPDICKERNESRISSSDSDPSNAYEPDILDNLIMRYEEPSSMVRWDSPLFTISWLDERIPDEDIWKAVTEGEVKPPNAGTSAAPKAPTDALSVLEQTASTMVSSILAEQSASGAAGGSIRLAIPSAESSTLTVNLPPRNVTLSELQRLKRQFITSHKKAVTLGSTEKGDVDWSEGSVRERFAVFLENHLSL